jgi:Protein of unknown function (DUF1360)
MDPVARTPTEPVDYAALSAGYGTLLGALLVATRDHGEEPIRSGELLPLGVATFALTKLIAKEKVETWVREPFVEEKADGRRLPKGRRLRFAIGELLTCTRCTGAWVSLGLTGLRVLRPREGRVVTAVLTASAINDVVQTGFAWACAQTHVTQRRAGRGDVASPAGLAPSDGRR